MSRNEYGFRRTTSHTAMKHPQVYDKAEYHYDGEFPADLPIEQAFVHTGMFLGWIVYHHLYSDWF